MAKDALSAHARDEFGISDPGANPILAPFASAISFSAGATMPTLAVFLASREAIVGAVGATELDSGIWSFDEPTSTSALLGTRSRCTLALKSIAISATTILTFRPA
jgi:hypothetical protein